MNAGARVKRLPICLYSLLFIQEAANLFILSQLVDCDPTVRVKVLSLFKGQEKGSNMIARITLLRGEGSGSTYFHFLSAAAGRCRVPCAAIPGLEKFTNENLQPLPSWRRCFEMLIPKLPLAMQSCHPKSQLSPRKNFPRE